MWQILKGEDLDLGGGSACVRHSEPADQHVQQPRQVVQQEEDGLDLLTILRKESRMFKERKGKGGREPVRYFLVS